MAASNPIEPLAASVHHALLVGLEPALIPRRVRLPDSAGGTQITNTGEHLEARPAMHDVRVQLFSQVWGSTALGFPAQIAGSAMTHAYTTVVFGPREDALVYFDGRPAYHVARATSCDAFMDDLRGHSMCSVNDAAGRYGKQISPDQGDHHER